MSNKIITEKDFWMCTTGAVPAQLQGTRLGLKKNSGEVYITVEDKATSSFIDFGCTKYMLLMALAAAAAVVILAVVGVLTIATGGAALIALGAVAGLVGAAIGGVVGGLLCGQQVASKRIWSGSKSNFISQGTKTITGDHSMICAAGGKVSFAPQIKSWSQAIALGGANYLGKLMEGMMAGAAVGMGGAIVSGGAGAIATGGMRGLGQATLQFAKSMPKNFVVNVIESVSKFGLAMRGIMGVQNTAQTYGETGTASVGDFAKGTVAMETGTYDSVVNITTGKGTWQDYVGIAMMVAPVGKGKRDLEAEMKKRADDAEAKKKADEEGKNKEEESSKKTENQEAEGSKKKGDGEAYEMSKGISDNNKYFSEGEPVKTENPMKGQPTSSTCLPTCLDVVLRKLGFEFPSYYIEGALKFDEGAYLKDVPDALKDLGLENKAEYSNTRKISDIEAALNNGDQVIASVNDGKGSHAVIVEGIENGNVILKDPLPVNQGSTYSIPIEVFENSNKGTTIIYK